MTEKKKHHYIPQFYLAGFTETDDNKGPLYVFDHDKMEIRKSKPVNEAYSKHLYRIEKQEWSDPEGKLDFDPNKIEDMLADIEGHVAPRLKRVIDNPISASSLDWETLYHFIAVLYFRTPKKFKQWAAFEKLYFKHVIKDLQESPSLWEQFIEHARINDSETYDRFKGITHDQLREGIPNLELKVIPKGGWCTSLMLSQINEIYLWLRKRRWVVLTARANRGHFICSDNPVALHWTNSKMDGFYSPGHGMPGTTVTMPLNRNTAIVGTFEGKSSQSIVPAPKELIAQINSKTDMSKERLTFSHKDDYFCLLQDGTIDYVKTHFTKTF